MLRFAARTQRLAVSTTTLLAVLSIHPLIAETVSPLTARGYTVLPVPQNVELGQQDFALTDGWQLVPGPAPVHRHIVRYERCVRCSPFGKPYSLRVTCPHF